MSGVTSVPVVSGARSVVLESASQTASASSAAELDGGSAVHPVALIESQAPAQAAANQATMLARIYGQHVPIKMRMEQTLLSQFRRPLSSLPSSHLGLSIVLGEDESIDWHDVRCRNDQSETMWDPRSEVEQRFDGGRKRRIF